MVLQLLLNLGIENGWTQEIGASENYVPDFEREGHPFVSTHKRRK
jgi:putative pyruvate formate lyase activating enzyme